MPRYVCLIRGEHFLRTDAETGIQKEYGFYTSRWIWAKSFDEAETKALAKLKRDKTIKFCAQKTISKVYFENIEISNFSWFGFLSQFAYSNPLKFGKGCTWYEMKDEEEE